MVLRPLARDGRHEVDPEMWARRFERDHPGSPIPVHTSPPPDWAPGPTPPPFVWEEERRARLRAELDALYAHLYGLTREELDYILETFPIVKRKDEERYGEYRTKRMILRKYEQLQGGSIDTCCYTPRQIGAVSDAGFTDGNVSW